MKGQPYTLAFYRVKLGREEEFISRWRNVAMTFSSLTDPPIWGTLIRSTTSPNLFYSFGPWRDPSHVLAMRSDPSAQQAFAELGSLCLEVTPGNYEAVEHVMMQ